MALTITEPEGQEAYPIYRYLEDVGDGTGSETGHLDYSSTAKVLRVNCRANELLTGHLLFVHIQDGGTFDPGKYGALAAITNGVIVGVFGADGVEKHRLTQNPIHNHGEWAHLGLSTTAQASAGDMMFIVRIDLASGLDDGLKLYPGESMRVTLNDNFTGLVDHHFVFHGGRRKR